MLNCWKGYIRKVLVFNRFGRKKFVLFIVVIVFYIDVSCCCCYKIFKDEFKDLDGNWVVVNLEILREVLG